MFPTQVGSVYRQDLNALAAWLASTAKSRGFPAKALASKTWDIPRLKTSGGRLKGKERKVAKDAASAIPYTVSFQDFLPLAVFIARCTDPVIAVPDSFFNTLDRALCTRINFGDRLGRVNMANDIKTYAPLVAVLAAIRDALLFGSVPGDGYDRSLILARGEAVDEDTKKNIKHDSRREASPVTRWRECERSNGYWTQYLREKFPVPGLGHSASPRDVDEEEFQTFLDKLLEPIERPTAIKNDTVNYVAEISAMPDDLAFTFQILTHELSQIRVRIEWIWSTNLDTAAASLATTTAVKLARGLIEEVMPTIDKHFGELPEMLELVYTMQCNARGFKTDSSAPITRDTFQGDRYDIANSTYFSTYHLMDAIFAHTTEDKGMAVHGDSNEVYDPASDRSAKSSSAKFDEDAFLLRELYAELMAAVKAMAAVPLKDELLWRMEEFLETKKLTLPFVFAVQCYLDINYVLRDEAEIVFRKAYDEANVIGTHIEEYVRFHKRYGKDIRLPPHDEGLGVIRPWMELTKCDPVHQLRVAARQECGLPVPEHVKPHGMFMHSPVMTGIWLFQIRIIAYSYGLKIANTWNSITSCAHLYNTLVQEGLLKGEWTDMEVVMRLVGAHNLWIDSEKPRNLEDCVENWRVQRGVTVSHSGHQRRGGGSVVSRTTPRPIVHEVPVTSHFVGFESGQLHDTTLMPSDVARIVDDSFYKATGTDDGGAVVMEKVANFKVLKQQPRLRNNRDLAAIFNGDANPIDRSCSQLIHDLVVALQGEAREVGFPWLVMHRYCWGLLRNIKKKCDPIFRPIYGATFLEKEYSLGELTTYCLINACARKTGGPDRRGLDAAASVVNKMIASGKGKRGFEFSQNVGLDIDLEIGKSEDDEEEN